MDAFLISTSVRNNILFRDTVRYCPLSEARALVRAFVCVPSMTDSLEVQVLYRAPWRRCISEAQGSRREAGSERSVEQDRSSPVQPGST